METTFRSRNKSCTKCGRELINALGIHMGIPFTKWFKHVPYSFSPMDRRAEGTEMLVCSRCYDEITVDLDHKTELKSG